MQTRKHFIQTAQIVAKIENETIRRQTALEFAHNFKRQNPRFDTFRFMTACNASLCTGGATEHGYAFVNAPNDVPHAFHIAKILERAALK